MDMHTDLQPMHIHRYKPSSFGNVDSSQTVIAEVEGINPLQTAATTGNKTGDHITHKNAISYYHLVTCSLCCNGRIANSWQWSNSC